MQVPVDESGLEWWEKLTIEKQDRVALPTVTAEVIEDIHWQLVVELDEKSLENALKVNGKLPGSSCGCKACAVHKSESSCSQLLYVLCSKLSNGVVRSC